MITPEQEFDEWAKAREDTSPSWRFWTEQKRRLWLMRRSYLAGRYADDATADPRLVFARWLVEHHRIREDLPVFAAPGVQ